MVQRSEPFQDDEYTGTLELASLIEDKELTFRDVLINFVASNWAIHLSANFKNLTTEFQRVHKEIRQLSSRKLELLVKDKERLDRIRNHHWFRKNIELKFIGSWPFVGDLLINWCTLSVVDIAQRIRDSSGKPLRGKSLRKILELQKNISIIMKYFPPIVVQGGEITTNKNLLFLPFDADDGSHCCIAAALAGLEKIEAMVGYA